MQDAGNPATSEEVQKLKEAAAEAQQKANEAQEEAQKLKDAENKAQEGIETAKTKVTQAENNLKGNEVYKKLDTLQTALKNAKKEADAAEEAYKKEYEKVKLDSNVEKGFDGFLDYVISKYQGDSSTEGKAIYEDAQRAKNILSGTDVIIPDKVIQTTDGRTITYPGRTIKAPMWYKDLVKLHRVGGADSLKNLQDAATYYEPLNADRQNAGLSVLGVRLSMIAESIVNSYYSGAILDHSRFHDDDNVTPSMNTHPYDDSAENLAWGPFDKYDARTRKHRENTGNEDLNAMDGWYDAEKSIYENAINNGTWTDDKGKVHNFSAADKTFLEAHRNDFLHQTYSSDAVDETFEKAVGHYLNFVDNKNKSCGFADGNNSALSEYGENVVVWHGTDEDPSLSVSAFQNLLKTYITSVTGSGDSAKQLEPRNAEKLKNLSAKTVEKNKAFFDARYKLRKVQYDFNLTPDDEKSGLMDQELALLQNQKKDVTSKKEDLDKKIQKAEDFVKKYKANPNANWPADAKENCEYNEKTYLPWAKEQSASYAESINEINNSVNTLNASISNANTKRDAYEGLRDAIDNAENGVNAATAEHTKAKQKANAAESTYKDLQKKAIEADQKATAAETAAQQAATQTEQQRKAKIQKLQNELQKLNNDLTGLQTDAQQKQETANNARQTAKDKQAKIDGDLTDAVKNADANVKSTTEAVQKAEAAKKQADEALKAANQKVKDLNKQIQTLDATIKSEAQKSADAQTRIDGANTKLTAATKTQTEAKNALDTAKETAAKRATELNKAKAAVSEKIEAVKAAKKTVKAAKDKVEKAQQTLEAAKAKVKAAKEKVTLAETKFNEIIAKLPKDAQQKYTAKFAAAAARFTKMQESFKSYTEQLETLTTTLTKTADALKKNVKDPAPTPSPEPAPSPVPSPSEDTTPGSGSASGEESGEASSSDHAGGSDYSSSNWYSKYLAGYANNLFGSEQLGFNVAVPAAQSQSANGANGANAQNANGVAANNVAGGAHANTLSASSANRIAAALVAGAKAAAKNAAKADEAKKDDAKSESSKNAAKDSAKSKSKSDSKNDSKSESKDESKNTQAAGGEENAAQSASNSTTLKIVAALATVVAGIAAIGGGTYFARHRRP